MSLSGELVVYDSANRLLAFKSGCLASKTAVVLIGGLTDGLLSLPYVDSLNEACSEKQHMLIQPLLRSSYNGFGHCSLGIDAEDLTRLLNFLENNGTTNIHLLGHSTGCQDILWLLKTRDFDIIKSATLQGPVSDADYIQNASPELVAKYEAIKDSLEMDDDFVLPFKLFGAPISAYRFRSLAIYGGDDDMFSYKSKAKQSILPKELPVLVVMSGKDQYVPAHINTMELLNEFNAEHKLYLPDADHFIGDDISQRIFITTFIEFVTQAHNFN